MAATGAANKRPWMTLIRMLVISIMAFGYASTMPRGPETREYLNLFGYDPSWFAINIVFMISGYLAMQSLARHGSAVKLLLSRAARNLPSLGLFALIVVFVFYPLLGVAPKQGTPSLSQHLDYFLSVVSCVDPGKLTPGLLDNALYKCVIHGGLWTFRWGAVAFIGTAILWSIGGLRNRRRLLTLTAFSALAYAASVLYGVRHPDVLQSSWYSGANVALRLGWIYLAGMCFYAWQDVLPHRMMIGLFLFFLALVQFLLLPWTPFIEITATLGFGWLCWLAMTSDRPVPAAFENLPDLSLGIYIYNWPSAQILLLLLPGLGPMALFALSFPVTLLLAWLNWWVLSGRINSFAEKPSLPGLVRRS